MKGNHFYFLCLSAAYSTDEIEEKTRSLRESVNYTAGDDASASEVSAIGSFACSHFESEMSGNNTLMLIRLCRNMRVCFTQLQ